MQNKFDGGAWPTMITPYTDDNHIDYGSLEKSIEWYIDNGCTGLFAVCQSSEMFYLSLQERTELASFVTKQVAGRIPVVVSGHISEKFEDQITELNAMAATGADALILISNRLGKEDEPEEQFVETLDQIVNRLPKETRFGFYECPYPYKKIISKEIIDYSIQSGRFDFLKDTSCNIQNIGSKLEMIKGSNMKLYNANTSTLLESLRLGATGYSGVMANIHPDLYAWLLENWKAEPEKAERLQDVLTACSWIELHSYPVIAKYMMQLNGIPMKIHTRSRDEKELTETFRSEARQIQELSVYISKCIKEGTF